MNRASEGRTSLALVAGVVGVALALGFAQSTGSGGAQCGQGFIARGAYCEIPTGECPAPLEPTAAGCDAPEVRVLVPEAELVLGPSDWEAEGRVKPRVIRVSRFAIDAFEATRGLYGRFMGGGRPADGREALRAASGMTRAEAAQFCALRGGRLPTEDEWMSAAASGKTPVRRYPWGDTGAVCRRGAWGLATGPCTLSADGPDTVASHPSGDSPLGIHDLAGNVAEWVAPAAGDSPEHRESTGVAKGGSWATALATELRIWSRLELGPSARDPRVGVRCAYAGDSSLRYLSPSQ
jgi:formylglycine-generating enzyme required for sulfatase activity